MRKLNASEEQTTATRIVDAVSRRALLAGLATAPAVAAAPRLGALSGGQKHAGSAETAAGYRLTAHVRSYYDAARF